MIVQAKQAALIVNIISNFIVKDLSEVIITTIVIIVLYLLLRVDAEHTLGCKLMR